ncbi:MAG: cell wall-binding repeat-containing protein, partial [Terrimesophilobacter sp.]
VTGSAPNYAPVSSLPSLGVTIAPATLTTAVPTISGNPLVGQTLTADAGAWSPGTVALTYQWYADNVAITSATGSTYILTGAENGKTITVTVTGTLAGYTTASETSAGFGPIGLPQIQAGTPEILGSAFVGGSLSVDTHDDTWTPTSGLTYGYVWKADGSPISGATSPTFTVTDNEIGKTITVTVTGSATDYISAAATSGPVGPVASPVIVAATPTISGTPTVDQVLTADAHAAGWTPATGLTFTYVWKADGTTISGATMSTYTLTAAEAGAVITVTVTGSKLNYVSGSATSDPTAAVAKGTITPATPTLTGTGKIGQPLNVDLHSADWAPSGVALTYVWKANGATISGATSLSYTPTASDLGKTIVVTATGTLAGYTTAMKTSLGVTVINGTLVVSRLAGVDRYETSVKISEKWNTATKVYIANGLGYADALSAGPAAAHFHAPLLLTAPASLPPVVVTELNRLHPTEIVIVGGVGAVSAAVENALNALSFHPLVTRVAGIDRYATSRALAIDTWGPGSLGTAYLATGTDFPDALSAAPAAAHFGGPVVLIPGMASSVDTATLNLLTYLGVDKIKIAGGAGVVSAAIEAQVRTIFGTGNVTRNGGIDRYATSVAINADEFTSASTVYLAQGMGFPDALAGAAIAGNNGAPLFVSQATCIPQSVLDAISHLGATSLVLLGGTGVLSPAVESLTSCGPTS